jgi:hypothetical protein
MDGFVGVAGLIVLALRIRSIWFGVISAFILLNCWGGLKQARALLRLAKAAAPRGVCLSVVQSSAASGKPLDLRTV